MVKVLRGGTAEERAEAQQTKHQALASAGELKHSYWARHQQQAEQGQVWHSPPESPCQAVAVVDFQRLTNC